MSYAQEKEGVSITVSINNVSNNNGNVIFALHTSETFMKGPGIQNTTSAIEEGKVTVTFKNVTPGTYSIIALHDENDNKRMDFEDNGMPKEDFGLSNNSVSFGPPQFEPSKFEVKNADLDIMIRF